MARQSRSESRAELFDVLDALDGIRAYLYPQQPTETGSVVFIEGDGSSWTAEDWVWPVRLYRKASEPTAPESEAALDDVLDLIDQALLGAGLELTGAVAYLNDEKQPDLWIATLTVSVPRQDFMQG